ncbi:MAG: ABC transporter ATP-binding protein [Rhodobacteraceae bacterium]|nr:ABC transporter ATP-binding protein [Paracoccaceae bacterium]
MMIVSGLVEMFTISAMFPFLAIVARPEIVETNPTLAGIYDLLGFTTVNGFLAFAGIAVFVIVVFGLLFATLTQYAIYRFAALRGASIGRRLLAGYLRQPYSWFLNQHSATVGTTILSEVNEVVLRVMLPGLKMIAQIAVALFLIVLLVVAQPVAAFTAAGLIGGVYAAIYAVARKHLTRMGRQRKQAALDKFKVTGEAMGGIKAVKLMGLEEVFLRRYERPAVRAALASAAVGVASEVPRNALRAVTLGGILLFVVVMLVRGNGDLSGLLPILGLYAFAGLRLLPALQLIYMGLTQMRFGRPALDKLYADISEHLPPVAAPAADADAPAIRLRARLELRDVRYAYPNAERGALNGLDLAVEARTSVGVVGGTGAGKTTAVDVILGLLRPQAGALVVDGVPVSDAAVRGWQKSIGYVPQHIFLVDDTVTANVAFGVEPKDVDAAAVERAARIAELHDFVTAELPLGYKTMLGERGVRLSGGQRQRIGIARALYHDPDVLVLDEATSALDNLTERVVMDAVQNLGREKTIIMIAHRLSTVRDCDRIFLLEGGRVVAEGTYDALVESNAEFRRLVSIGRG